MNETCVYNTPFSSLLKPLFLISILLSYGLSVAFWCSLADAITTQILLACCALLFEACKLYAIPIAQQYRTPPTLFATLLAFYLMLATVSIAGTVGGFAYTFNHNQQTTSRHSDSYKLLTRQIEDQRILLTHEMAIAKDYEVSHYRQRSLDIATQEIPVIEQKISNLNEQRSHLKDETNTPLASFLTLLSQTLAVPMEHVLFVILGVLIELVTTFFLIFSSNFSRKSTVEIFPETFPLQESQQSPLKSDRNIIADSFAPMEITSRIPLIFQTVTDFSASNQIFPRKSQFQLAEITGSLTAMWIAVTATLEFQSAPIKKCFNAS